MTFLLALLGLDSLKPSVTVTLTKDEEGAVTLKTEPALDPSELSELTHRYNERAAMLPPGSTIVVTRTRQLDARTDDRIIVQVDGETPRRADTAVHQLADAMKDIAVHLLDQVVRTGQFLRDITEETVLEDLRQLCRSTINRSLMQPEPDPLPTRVQVICPNCLSAGNDGVSVSVFSGRMGLIFIGELMEEPDPDQFQLVGLVPHRHPLYGAVNNAWGRWVEERLPLLMREAALGLREDAHRLTDRLTTAFALPALTGPIDGPPRIAEQPDGDTDEARPA